MIWNSSCFTASWATWRTVQRARPGGGSPQNSAMIRSGLSA